MFEYYCEWRAKSDFSKPTYSEYIDDRKKVAVAAVAAAGAVGWFDKTLLFLERQGLNPNNYPDLGRIHDCLQEAANQAEQVLKSRFGQTLLQYLVQTHTGA